MGQGVSGRLKDLRLDRSPLRLVDVSRLRLNDVLDRLPVFVSFGDEVFAELNDPMGEVYIVEAHRWQKQEQREIQLAFRGASQVGVDDVSEHCAPSSSQS